MSRSPLAYPLNRGADTDVGGAADLQTDIMRFMAILSMCLLAIFALVQSIPLAPIEPELEPVGETKPVVGPSGPIAAEAASTTPEAVIAEPVEGPSGPIAAEAVSTTPEPVIAEPVEGPSGPIAAEAAPTTPEQEGFTLRFASDAALLRAVAARHVGLYAIENNRARRMAVSDSRISFWDASTPNAFHEMETGTVPAAVMQALERAGADSAATSWGVTLPGRMTSQLDELMKAHRSGSLVITADGEIHWEAS